MVDTVCEGRWEAKLKRLVEVLKQDVSSGEEGAEEDKMRQWTQGWDQAGQPCTLLQCKQASKGQEAPGIHEDSPIPLLRGPS